jgi:amino acid adenylation domain-containing protein
MVNSRLETSAPLSPAQRDLLLESSSSPGSAPHVIGTSIGLGPDLDPERWERAARAVFRSEAGMRLRLVWSGGEPHQAVDPGARLSTEVVSPDAGLQEDVGAWCLRRLAVRADIETDASFQHALVRDRSGDWNAVLMAPHIFVDGHAFRHFFERTARIYEGEGEPDAGSSDGASAERLFGAAERAAAQMDLPETIAFWRERLAGVSPLLFRTRKASPGGDVEQLETLSAEDSASIEEYCRERGLHPADFFLAVFAIVLERFREREGDWVVHTIKSTRGPDERDLMGCFYRAMPSVLDPARLALPAGIADLLSRAREERRALRGRMRISMLALQELLPRGGARAVFNYYDFHEVRALGSVRQMRSHFLHRPDELHLVIARRAEGFELRLRFHTSTFSEERLLTRLSAVAGQIAAGAARVFDCDWLLADERPAPLPRELAPPAPPVAVEELFERRARADPHGTALVFEGEHLSYGDLDRAANRLARRLVREGVGPETLVGIHLDRSFEQVAAILAILKAGGAYVPIDPDYPQERVAFILADAGVGLLVGRDPSGEKSAKSCVRRIPFEDVRTDFSDESGEGLGARASPENAAYVIYTSGSTGRPKGTVVTRGNLARLFPATQPLFEFGPSDVWTLLHSCAFDFSVWEIFGALAFGGRLVVVPSKVARSPADLARLVDDERVTVLNQTPSAFFHLAAARELEGESLRYVIFGGEALEVRKLKPWFDRFGDAAPRLVNMYGITETTVHVTHRPLTKADTLSEESPIGRALADLDVFLVDSEGRLVPRGCSGEILVGGAGVARGYLGRDDLTRERFLEDTFRPGGLGGPQGPLPGLPGRRVYRSGDLARESSAGGLEFLGRIDDQVKIRGYRVETGEVAAVLAEHPSVREAVVVAHSGPEGPHLVGYAVPAEGSAFDEAELLRFLRRRLPGYMTCARVLAVAAFPLTAHGKLDRNALPVPVGRPPDSADFVPPRTATEELVASLFSEATGVARVGAEDDFFNLGGHSLGAMRVAARLREVFQVPGSASLVFEHPTVAELARSVDERRGTACAADRPKFAREPRRDALPLTYAQERVFLLQRLHPEMVAYNFEAAIRFRGRLDAAHLGRALAHLVRRHEALRTTFHEEEGRPFQRVHETGIVAFEELDYSLRPRNEADRRVEELRRDLARRPFDPGTLPLIEWRLVKVAADEHVLLHREHHLIHDGWSFVVLVRDLLELYRAEVEARPASLPAAVALGDYAAGHRRWIEGPAGDEQRRYWEERLAGVPERLELPADRVRPAVFSFRGDQFRFDLPDDLVTALRAAARREGLTLYMLMLSAFSLVLSRLAGSEDLCVAAGVANRRWEEIESTIGMLLNNVVFRLRPRPQVSVRGYAREVREEVLGALANQDLPFGEIVGASGVPRSLSETPLVRAFFSSYEGPLPDLRLPELDVELEAGLPNGSAKFDWNVIVLSQPGRSAGDAERVTVLWEYSTDAFDPATMERARRQFLAAIRSLIADFDRPLSEVAISDEEERRFLIEAGEGARTPYPRDATIPDLFARQVAARGNAVALRERETACTYGELGRRAERIAGALRARDVGPEEPVAFLLPRGIGAVAAMLGILEADAAYLPLSPKDPPARLARLVADVGARFVLTDVSFAASLSGVPAEVLLLDRLLGESGGAGPIPRAGADSLAAILFTSGSTGQPKGVEVVHRGVVRLLFGADYVFLGPEEKILQLAPLSFDASTFEIFGALLHGGELVIFPEDLPSAGALGKAIAGQGITTAWLNASLFNAIVDEDPGVLSPLAQLLVGGEALSVAHVARARRFLPGTRLVNGYGPTENTTFSCCYQIPHEIDPQAVSIPIGRPIAHSRARVLDSRRDLAPGGAIGEIYVGGDGLARGYRNRAEATAEAFVADPLDPAPGARLYRTGDLGRVRADGLLEFRGRRDSQVKIRGFRIEPGEIEAALRRIPGVGGASVQPVDDPARGRSLVAFVIPERGATVPPETVLRALSRELPPHLLPSRVLERPALPVTPNGKIDAAMLVREAKEALRLEAWPPPAEAKSALEGVIASAFADVLGRADFGADEDFFAAGGHSLLVFRVLARLEKALGMPVEPSSFLHGPTPRQLAREIERRRAGPLPAGGAATASRSIVEVTRGERSLFFVPGGEGGDLALGVYARLSLYLPGTGFFGFRVARDGGLGEKVPASVEELAAGFVADLRGVQPEGPYDLAGGCIGGIVAYEMARQLLAAGKRVRNLVLLDTIYPSVSRRARQRTRGFCSRARRGALDLLERAPGLRGSSRKWLYENFSRLLPYDEHEASANVPLEWISFGDMILRYRPKPLRARTALLASEELIRTDGPRRWAAAVGGDLAVRRLPGTHWNYIREHVAEVGAALRAVLEEPR